jgi:hypothetical protein
MTTTPVEDAPLTAALPAEDAPPQPVAPEVRERVEKTVAAGRAELEDATFDFMMSKPRRKVKFPLTSVVDGQPVTRMVRYTGLSPTEYDKLLAAHPATALQREKGYTYNEDTFAPAIIAAVSTAPKMTVEQATALWTNEDYSSGERRELFLQALDACAAGLNVPFNAGD